MESSSDRKFISLWNSFYQLLSTFFLLDCFCILLWCIRESSVSFLVCYCFCPVENEVLAKRDCIVTRSSPSVISQYSAVISKVLKAGLLQEEHGGQAHLPGAGPAWQTEENWLLGCQLLFYSFLKLSCQRTCLYHVLAACRRSISHFLLLHCCPILQWNKQVWTIRVHPQSFLDILLILYMWIFAWIPGIFLSLCLQHWSYYARCTPDIFKSRGIWTWVLLLAWQVLFWLSLLPSSGVLT